VISILQGNYLPHNFINAKLIELLYILSSPDKLDDMIKSMTYTSKQTKVLFTAANLQAAGVQKQLLYILRGISAKGEITSILFLEKPECR
jgi:hypothetical protein